MSLFNTLNTLTLNILAANIPEQGPAKITNPALGPTLQSLLYQGPTAFLQNFLPRFIGVAFVIGAIVFIFMLLIGGIQWISAGGDKASIESARGRVMHAFVGLLILFSTFAVLKFLEIFFGINLILIDIGPLIIQ